MPDAPETRPAPTPGQTVGPFFGYALPFAGGHELVEPGAPGALRLHGVVRDGAGAPVPDALIEIWQADAAGRVPRRPGSLARDGATFTGFGRAETDRSGRYWLRTVEPGPTEPARAAFFAVTVFARGLLDRLFTRAYVPGPALADDPLLRGLDDAARRTLIAVPDDGGLRFDIVLQGPGETVFLAFPGRPRLGVDGGGGPASAVRPRFAR